MAKKSDEVYSHEAELERWKEEYLEIKKLLPKNMDADRARVPESATSERRTEPRYAFEGESKIYAHLGPKAFPILNISIGGLAFYSDFYFDPGTKLLMSALGMIALDVEVLSCEMEEVDAVMMEYKYRVRAKFGPRVNGYQVYVLAREMYLQEQEGGEFVFSEKEPE